MSWWQKVKCRVLGHKYRAIDQAQHGKTVQFDCIRCLLLWAMHGPTHSFVPWDGEIEAEFYENQGRHSKGWPLREGRPSFAKATEGRAGRRRP